MSKLLKITISSIFIIILCGCSMPFQSEEYPAWKTNGIIESETLSDGRIVNGYQGLYIDETAHTNWLDITLKEVIEEDNNLTAIIEITNTSDDVEILSKEDFSLMWDLEKENSYTYSTNDISGTKINPNETITLKTSYLLNESMKKPYAIFYGEVYEDDIDGNSFYFYIK